MLVRRRVVGLACALAIAAGCAGSAPRASDRTRPAASCDELLARYRDTLAHARATCASDDDCVVYGGVDPDAVCGGATDAETGRALSAIAAERDAAGCPRPGYSCPPIDPRCVDGACR